MVRVGIPQRNLALMTNVGNRIIRKRITAERKRQAFAKAKNKCQHRGCNIRNPLKIHHKNHRSDDNALKNLKVFCSIHHDLLHQKEKIVYKRNPLGVIIGRGKVRKKVKKLKKKVIKKKPIKKRRKETGFFGGIMRTPT